MKISELARRCGLARSTLLYYEKLGVIAGTRAANGYRHYDDEDLQRLLMVQALQAGGLSLKQCLACLAGELEQATLQARVRELDEELAQCSAPGICWRISPVCVRTPATSSRPGSGNCSIKPRRPTLPG
jgi:DNA-binding transcriptional MerR regulator